MPFPNYYLNYVSVMRSYLNNTYRLIDEKFGLSEFGVKNENNDDNMNRILGEAYAGYKEYQTGIVLFYRKSSKDEAKHWTISVNGSLNLSKGELNLEVIGKRNNSKIDMTEKTPKKHLDYGIIFSNIMTESDQKNQFLIVFLNSTLENFVVPTSKFYPP